VIKSRRTRWAGHVAPMVYTGKIYKILIENLKVRGNLETRSLGVRWI